MDEEQLRGSSAAPGRAWIAPLGATVPDASWQYLGELPCDGVIYACDGVIYTPDGTDETMMPSGLLTTYAWTGLTASFSLAQLNPEAVALILGVPPTPRRCFAVGNKRHPIRHARRRPPNRGRW